jgi:hypothetical protein
LHASLKNQTESVALDLLTEMVTKLNDNPGMFDIFQKKFTEMFFELAGNHFVLSNAVELLFEQVSNTIICLKYLMVFKNFLHPYHRQSMSKISVTPVHVCVIYWMTSIHRLEVCSVI